MASASIDLRSAEDVSGVLNLTFQLIRARWRLFLKAVFYFGGAPLILAIGCFGGGGLVLLYGGTGIESQPGLLGAMGFGFAAAVLLGILGTALAIAGTLAVVRLHVEKGDEPYDVNDVWEVAKSSVLGVIGLQILNGLAIMVLVPIAVIPCLGAIAWMAWVLFVTVRYFFLAIPLRVIEGNSALQSISRAGSLVKNYFWDTAGIFLVIYMVQTILSTVFMLPFQLLMFSGEVHNLDAGSLPGWMLAGLGALFLLALAGSILLSGVMYVAGAVQAFTLKDRKEEAGVEARVEQLEQEVVEDGDGDVKKESRQDASAVDGEEQRTDGGSPDTTTSAEKERPGDD